MSLEEIIERILASNSNLKRNQILEMIENKKKASGEFLTDETAARIVASELGLQSRKKPIRLEIQIQDLVSGLNDVTIIGKILAVYPTKTFTRRDWTEGKMASLLISDNNRTIRVVLWDEKVEMLESSKIQREQTIRVSHAYVRQGWGGDLELHVGKRGYIEVLQETKK